MMKSSVFRLMSYVHLKEKNSIGKKANITIQFIFQS